MRSQKRHLRVGERRATARHVQPTSKARTWTPERACDHPEEDVRRAKSMEHHEDGDGDMVMDLTCTGDFDECRELTAEARDGQGLVGRRDRRTGIQR